MEDRKKIEERLRKKEHEVDVLEERLKTARVYVQALQDVLKLLDKSDEVGAAPAVLKAGSAVAQAREIILDRGEPVHITALLEAMGKDASRETRASLTSSLAAYVRRSEIFTRPAPNTFGLVELGHTTEEQEEEPPADFGRIKKLEPPVPPSIAQRTSPAPPIATRRPPILPVPPQPTSPSLRPSPSLKPPPSPPKPAIDEDDDIPF